MSPSPPVTPPQGGSSSLLFVAHDAVLRRVIGAYQLFAIAENATWLAVLVYAFERGGVRESGLVALLQLAPAIFVAPFAAYAGDRFRRDRVLQLGYLAQAVAMALTALGMASGSVGVTYLAATVVASCVTFTRPVMSAIIPDLTRTPDGLVAANVVTGSLGELGAAIGPIVAGLIIFFGSPGWVFAACSLLMFAATVVVSRLYLHASFRRVHTLETADVIGHVFDGVRVLGQHRNVRVMVALLSMKALVAGVLDVVGVAFAGERLGAGGGTAGVLAGAVGFGAVVGSAAAAGLSRGGRTVRFLVISAFLVGLPLVILDSVERMPFGLMLVMLCGAGAGLLRVTSTVAIQRFGPLSALTRIFGIAEGLQMFALAVGSYGVAELTSRTSLSTALLVAGIGLTSAVLLGTWQFSRTRPLDVAVARDVLQRLVADPHLRRLPAPAIERVARSVEHVAVAAGEVVIRQGDHGDRYFVVLDGSFDVIVDGAHVGTLDASGSFGSVALLNDVARTATVVATSSADLLAVPRADFLEAVTGRPEPASMTATS